MPDNPPPSSDVRDLIESLEELARMIVRFRTDDKVSLSTAGTLKTLARTGPVRLSALAVSEHVTQPAMTQIVNRLEKLGLVHRELDEEDGRAVLVRLSPSGLDFLQTRRDYRAEQVSPLFDALEPGDQDAIVRALPALAHFIELGLPTNAAQPFTNIRQVQETSIE